MEYKFNNNLDYLCSEKQTKEIKQNVQIEKKKMLDLKKRADNKIKLKIIKVEEIDNIILKK